MAPVPLTAFSASSAVQSVDSSDDLDRLRQHITIGGVSSSGPAVARLYPMTPQTRPRSMQSPQMSFGSDVSFDDTESFLDLPPAGGSWTVDPNFNVPENFTLTGVDLTSARLPDRMKDLMDDYVYWLSLVERLGFDRSIFNAFTPDSPVPSLEVLSRYFDSSHLGLLRVFHIFDKDKDTLITRAEIANGLHQQGFYTHAGNQAADLAFSELCDLLTRSTAAPQYGGTPVLSGTVVSPPEFLLALRCLRLAAVVHGYMHPAPGEAEEEIALQFHEYREDRIETHLPLEAPISFLFRSPDDEQESESRVYWIHCHEPSPRTVLALGVKYGLDPRFTLDVLSLWQQTALVDRALSYVARTRGPQHAIVEDQPFLDREWIFSVIPVIRLTEASLATLQAFSDWRMDSLRKFGSVPKRDRPLPPDIFIEVDTCNVAMFVTGQALGGTVISFANEWSLMAELDTSNDVGVVLSPRAEVEEEKPTNVFQPFSRIMSHLRTSYSHIRTGDSHTLFLKALCDITEDYVVAVQAHEAALTVLKIRLDKKCDALEQLEVQRIQACLRQINAVLKMVRPVAAVVDILETRDWSGDSQLYLSDLRANVVRFLDNASAVKETAKLLADQFRNYNETKTRKVLFALTLVTTLFVPPLFFVSLEGMNFQHGMSELGVDGGYMYFWILLVGIMCLIAVYYRWMHWI